MSSNFVAVVTSAVILEPKKIKSVVVSTLSPSICHEVMGPDAMILVFDLFFFLSLILDIVKRRPKD